MTEKVGLQSVWDNKQFNAGNAEYVKKVLEATKTTENSAKRFGVAWNDSANRWQTAQGKFISGATAASTVLAKLGEATKAPDGGLSKLGNTAGGSVFGSLLKMGQAAGGSALGGLMALGGGIGATIAITQSLITMVTTAISKVQEFGAESLQTAGRVQELTIVSQLLGQRAGLTAAEVTKEVTAIKEVGIRTDVANLLFAQFARYNLDTAQAVDLARVAQDAAVLSMEDSSQALDGLMQGILTYNKELLRNRGLNIDIQGAFEAYAATLGKSAEALTEQERVQATLNAVLAEGANIAGVYAAAMESPAKQARSLSRVIFELKSALGAPFLAAWGNVIGMVTSFVKALVAAVSEGGALYPVLIGLGAVADIVTEGLSKLAGVATDAGTSFLGNLTERLSTAASQAFTWGANIVIQLATGIISGAGNAIIAAMNYISNLLAQWLAPGSPPAVAPGLIDWGINAVSMFLSGFTKGDFSVLKAIQSPLKNALGTLVDMGELGQDAAGQIFADLSKQLIEQMNSGQPVDEQFFTDLANATGIFGEEIADLARTQLELAAAEAEVADAEARLAKAREDEAKAGAKVNQLTQEYNDALRSGATKEQLKERLAAINAAKAEQQLAKDQAADAEGDLEASKSKLDVLQEQAALQQELIAQLLELAKAQIPTPEPIEPEPPEPPGGAGGPPAGGVEPPVIDPGTFTDPISTAIDNAKAIILQKLLELWAAIKAQIQEHMGDIWNRFKEAWDRLVKAVEPVWNKIKEVVSRVLTFIVGEIQYWLDFAKGWWEEHGDSVMTVWGGLWNFVKGVVLGTIGFIGGLIQRGLDYIKGFWERHGETIMGRWQATWDTLKTVVGNYLEIIGNLYDFWAAVFAGDWSTAWEEMKAIWQLAWDSLKLIVGTALENTKTSYAIFAAEMTLFWTTLWDGLKTKLTEVWNAIVLYIQTKLAEAQTAVNTKLTEISTKWAEIWTGVQTKAQEIWDAIKLYIEEKIAALFEQMGIDLDEMKERWSNIWTDVQEIASTIWTRISTAVSEKVEEVRANIAGKVGEIQSSWSEKWEEIKTKLTTIWDTISTAVLEKIGLVHTTILTKIEDLKFWWGYIWDEIKKKASEIWEGILTKASLKIQEVYDAVTGKLEEVKGWIDGQVSAFKTAGQDLIQGFIDGALMKAGQIVDVITTAVENAIQAALDALQSNSPSKVFIKIGGYTMEGMAIGITKMAKQAAVAMQGAMVTTARPALAMAHAAPRIATAPVPITTNNQYRSMNVNMTNHVNNGMDMARLEQVILRTVKKGMRT